MKRTESARRSSGPLTLYVVLSYAAVLATAFGYFREVEIQGPLQTLYLGAVWTTYGALFLLVALLPVAFLDLLCRVPAVRRLLDRLRISRRVVLFVPAVLLVAALLMFLYTDAFLFHLFGFHMNGFVVNLVLTPGGIESMGSSESTAVTFALIALGFLALQCVLAFLALRFARRPRLGALLIGRRRIVVATVLLLLLAVSERVTYALSEVRGYTPVLVSSEVFPFYLPLKWSGLADLLGVEHLDRDTVTMRAAEGRLTYPAKPLVRDPSAPRRNIVWLVSESLRSDVMTPEIMPATTEFALRSSWFRDHLSGGNGTRMGIFSMFYGLYGPYWFPFLRERRGPVLIDELVGSGYQFGLFTSARFTYPEFDSTVFSRIPSECLHERSGSRKTGWLRDRENVDEILDFLDRRDPDRPFMTFMFFESPHARYYFPPESVIRRPYAEDVNYATMDAGKEAGLLFNRYVNACHHLDSQIARILDYLDGHGLMDDTIVVITGDHGEEFMERGRWGHNSDFVREQIQVPLVIHAPGRKPETVERLTSHLDIPPTILHLLGVRNPPEDYCLGHDLFGGESRSDAVVGSWDNLAWVDEQSFAVFPLKGHELWQQRYCDRNGAPLPNPDAFLAAHRSRLTDVLGGLRRFCR